MFLPRQAGQAAGAMLLLASLVHCEATAQPALTVDGGVEQPSFNAVAMPVRAPTPPDTNDSIPQIGQTEEAARPPNRTTGCPPRRDCSWMPAGPQKDWCCK